MKNVVHILPGLRTGGAEVLLAELIDFQATTPAHHTVIALSASENPILDDTQDHRVHTLDLKRHPISTIRTILRICRPMDKPALVGWLYIGAFVAFCIALIMRLRCVFYLHHSLTDLSVEKVHTRILISVLAFLTRFPTLQKVIFVSRRSHQQHVKRGFSSDKSITLYNGINLARFAPTAEAIHNTETVFNLGNFGRFHPVKDHALLFEIVAGLKERGLNIRLHLAGVGMTTENADIAQLVSSFGLGDDIVLHGNVKRIEELYAVLDAYILSSKAEAFPNVILEALCYGLLIASTPVGDVPDILPEDNVIIDRENLSQTIDELHSKLMTLDKKSRHMQNAKILQRDFDQNTNFETLLATMIGHQNA